MGVYEQLFDDEESFKVAERGKEDHDLGRQTGTQGGDSQDHVFQGKDPSGDI